MSDQPAGRQASSPPMSPLDDGSPALPESTHRRPSRRILVLATLDTKGDEADFLAERIGGRGHLPWVVDLSLAGTPGRPAQISRDQVAAAAGRSWAELSALPRAEAMKAVAAGASRLIGRMVERGEAHGVIALGGSSGSWMANAIMDGLTSGFPKLLVTTMVRGDGRRDIALMPSVADIAGVNRLLGPILANAAAAICGMAEEAAVPFDPSRPAVALTMYGVTTRGGTLARRLLEQAGCEVIVFHANGDGGAAMEGLIREGVFQGVLDWTTSEITDEVVGGVCTAGPDRLSAAAAAGIPQVVVPGAVDVINISGAIPERFAGRPHHMHTPSLRLIRTSTDESRAVGAWIAERLNRARGPVRVLIPAGGFSAVDAPGGPFWDPAADAAFEEGLRRGLDPGIPVEVLPHHINDEAFARAAAEALLAMGVARRPATPAGIE